MVVLIENLSRLIHVSVHVLIVTLVEPARECNKNEKKPNRTFMDE